MSHSFWSNVTQCQTCICNVGARLISGYFLQEYQDGTTKPHQQKSPAICEAFSGNFGRRERI